MGGQPMFLYNPFVILYLGFTNAPTLTDPASPEPNGFLVLPQNLSRPKLLLGTGMDTQDTSPSVLLFFDKQRFNAGEGLQRFCTEHKIKLSKV
ncbi:unnamed protein product [Prunus armeniaca]|uniref:tRNase Z endonuclease domain-containing protein n=1 Tax=Prunus armeniaca TaxID=36596 RepID=A0A6J5WH87_PRUAR|nr:unnamed protein product [Prunus armeniaca]